MIKRFLLLSDDAWKNMKKSILASTVTYFSKILLSMMTAYAFWQILQPYFGELWIGITCGFFLDSGLWQPL